MSRVRLYTDEDAMDGDLIRGLRSRGIDVVTATAVSMIRREDEAGIIVAQQQRYSTGEQIRRILRLIGSLTAEEMRNREEFLGRW